MALALAREWHVAPALQGRSEGQRGVCRAGSQCVVERIVLDWSPARLVARAPFVLRAHSSCSRNTEADGVYGALPIFCELPRAGSEKQYSGVTLSGPTKGAWVSGFACSQRVENGRRPVAEAALKGTAPFLA